MRYGEPRPVLVGDLAALLAGLNAGVARLQPVQHRQCSGPPRPVVIAAVDRHRVEQLGHAIGRTVAIAEHSLDSLGDRGIRDGSDD
ncbi:hypothetical protein BOH66_01090 [Microbacterium aurum]|uniref:Uncharacterized protein n=1 Tax=Microbacterium aurum TaxID=36805 RepID=A0A1P8U4L0_9MICO|nr:hypothetical protein BOH66_01090 [Microbacterium aurum]